MITDYESIDPGLLVRTDGTLNPDPLWDDQALFVKTTKGLVAVLGCAHRGIINTLRHAQTVTGERQIHAVIGGTHLLRTAPERVERTIADLKALGVQRLGVSHCTGFHPAARLAQEFGDAFFLNNAGTQIELP
jgi:7,8-dihydropterin-6-yl-methyl-4-(beta-D-ribofuranosyl)aminobenzene 5'-phosphate synthase